MGVLAPSDSIRQLVRSQCSLSAASMEAAAPKASKAKPAAKAKTKVRASRGASRRQCSPRLAADVRPERPPSPARTASRSDSPTSTAREGTQDQERQIDVFAEDRAIGAMLGLAVGDSLGAPLEFQALTYDAQELVGLGEPEHVWWYKPEEELVEGDKISYNKFEVRPGQWTDDTSMAFCLADSLLVCRGLD